MLTALLNRFFPQTKTDQDTFLSPAGKARKTLETLLQTDTPVGTATEALIRYEPALAGKPMFVLNRKTQKLAAEAGMLCHDPRYPHRLREPQRGDVLVKGHTLMVFDGHYCAHH